MPRPERQHTEKMRRFHLEMPKPLYDKLQDLSEEELRPASETIRKYTRLKLDIDARRLQLYKEGKPAGIWVAGQEVWPDLLCIKYTSATTARYHFELTAKMLEEITEMVKPMGTTITDYIKGALAFGIETSEITQSQEYPGKPYITPIIVGDQQLVYLV